MILSELRQQRAPRKERGPAAGNWSVDHGTGHGIQEGQPGRGGFLRHIFGHQRPRALQDPNEAGKGAGQKSRQVIERDCVAVDRPEIRERPLLRPRPAN